MAANPQPGGEGRVRRLERWAAACMLGSGAVHGILVREHLREWWGYGAFFAVAATVQAVWALALWTDAINPTDTGPRWRTGKLWLYGLGVLGNLFLVVLYVVTRTVGIPLLGPGAGEVEAVGAVDILSKALELAAGAILAVLWRRLRASSALARTPI